MGRAPCCEKVGLKRGRWTAEEDQILASYIAEHGEGSWRSLPKNAGLLRCGKSCRLRWINYLRADIKRGKISKEEEDTIIKLHATLGNRWSLIAGHLPGRTDNEIKNYWNSHLSRQIHTYHRKYTAGPDTTVTIDMSKLHSADKRCVDRTPGRSPKSAAASSCQTKSTKPDPEPKPESGYAKGGASSPSPAAHSDKARRGAGSEGPYSEAGGGEAQVGDLFDMDWDGVAAHLWGGPEQKNDLSVELQQQAAEPQVAAAAAAAACPPGEHELEAFETWLLSDSF